MKTDRQSNKCINITQILLGLISLSLGGTIYIITRCPNQTYFISKCFFDTDVLIAIPSAIRIIGNMLPDFIHPFAFILITSGLVPVDNRKGRFLICLGWFSLESIFELGQHFKEIALRMTPSWFEGIPFLENTNNYFLTGTFDVLDIFSMLFGTVLAFYVISKTSIWRH